MQTRKEPAGGRDFVCFLFLSRRSLPCLMAQGGLQPLGVHSGQRALCGLRRGAIEIKWVCPGPPWKWMEGACHSHPHSHSFHVQWSLARLPRPGHPCSPQPPTYFLSELHDALPGGGAKHAKLEFRASSFRFFSVVLMSLTC